MAFYGVRDLGSTALPSLWDARELERIRLASGTTFVQYLRMVQAGVAALNQSLVTGDEGNLFGRLVAMTDEVTVEYPTGSVGNTVRPATEYSDAIPSRGVTTGHMLPIRAWEHAFGWTALGLRKATETQLDADVQSGFRDILRHWQATVLQRLFRMEPEPVGSVANASPGFADGGLADPKYVPPTALNGKKFDATHNHYLRLATLDENAVGQAVLHLYEHDHKPPYLIIASEADRATWANMSIWVPPTAPVLRPAVTETRAAVSDFSPYDGLVEVKPYGLAYVVFRAYVPGGYFAVVKSYGALDQRNPLWVRWEPQVGVGWQLLPGREFGKRALAMLYAEFGVGIGRDRTAGVAVQIASTGGYTSPTITP